MKAMQTEHHGSPEVLIVTDVPVPQPGTGQVLIRVESAAVNYSDIIRRRGDPYPFPTPLPFTPGGDVAGTVEVLGEGVPGVGPGTPVFALANRGSGGYAQYTLAEAASVVPIPSGIGMDVAAGLIVAGTTAALLVRDAALLQPGETILVPAAAGGRTRA